LSILLRNTDVLIASLVIGIVLMIIIPLSTGVLDFLLIINITLSLIIFLTTLFNTHILDLSVFPTLLLITTLFRLSLNISSTRLILSRAGAGKVIAAFGDFVIGGNAVVGVVIFVIITVIQFVVITNGSGRVAEVAARFTLDAMPGKQMAVDADLNAGLINEQQAKERRRMLQRESDFYGAMDGASKFVKGDAIAGIVITLFNVIGGLVVGMVQLGLPLMDAVNTYIVLTVGDGLVSQLPALLISTATGILVTRSSSETSFGRELSAQLFAAPKVVGLTAVLLAGLGLVPALPTLPFLAVSAAAGYAAYVLYGEQQLQQAKPEPKVTVDELPSEPENVLSLVGSEQLEIEIGFGLVVLTDGQRGGELLERLASVRRRFILDQGLYVRPIRIRDNLQLRPNAYVFKIRGHKVAGGELMADHYLCMDYSGAAIDLPGVDTLEPTFGLPAKWVAESERETAELRGYTVVDSTTVLVTHLSETVKRHAHELLGRQEVKEMLETVKTAAPAVFEELTHEQVSIGEVQKVLQGLLMEGVATTDLTTILEAIADNVRQSRETDFILERVRLSLARQISQSLADDGKLHILTLHPRAEQQLMESLANSGGHIVLEPTRLNSFFQNLATQSERISSMGRVPVILCPSRLRLPLRRLTQRHFPGFSIMAPGEVSSDIEVESMGAVALE
jgi:flagellar biosynthesis protein FlhA